MPSQIAKELGLDTLPTVDAEVMSVNLGDDPDLMGPNRPGPKGFLDMPIPVGGLYLGGAGCHGGPGITFIPGYNAAYAVLDEARSMT